MDLTDRYLDAVRLFLPSAQRDDIVAELRDVLLNRREEKEAELGRNLDRREQEALLHEFGHPLIVAARYGRPQYLIGPELYPVYAFVLKIVLAAIALAAAITGVVGAAVAHGDAWRAFGQALSVIWTGGFAAVGAVTVIFAVLQRTDAGRRVMVDWRVSDLPRVSIGKRRRETWYERVAGIVFLSLFTFWWVGLIPTRTEIPLETGGVLHFAFAPALHSLYLPVLALAAGGIAVDAIWLAKRETRSIALALELVLQAAIALVAVLALHSGHWAIVTGPLPAAQLAQVDQGVNIGAQVTLIVVLAAAMVRFGMAAWSLSRRAPEGHPAAGDA
ncbi:MAG TPA: hypothetical protein VMT68_13405 [Caulobacteraceae bacterium]|nr:hypothetical protein [Caulobacteraceae bacterium]